MSAKVRRSPYVGLVPYAEEDWECFFGRQTETELIVANLMASRLTLLYGPSGVGKSSVLRAGVAHRLHEQARENRHILGVPGHALASFAAWRDKDPVSGLIQRLQQAVEQASDQNLGPPLAPGRFAEACADWAERVGGDLIIVLDQFEEYFLYHGAEDGEGSFAVEFPRWVNREGLPVNFLVSIREDALAKLDRFKGRIPRLFENYLRLNHLSLEAARQAIERPLERYNQLHPEVAVAIEPALTEEVLRQTHAGRVALGHGLPGVVEGPEADARLVEAPYLQLVMTRLWEEESALGSRVLRLSTLTERLKGVEEILRTHLDRELGQLDSAERDIAAAAFRFLVTRTGSKIALAVDDIAGYAELPTATLAPVLDKLAGARILRPVPVPDQPELTRYEISHDVLGPAIADWRRRQDAAKAAEELRRREAEQRQRAVQEVEQQRQRELTRYTRIALVGALVLCGILLGMTVFAFQQRMRAVDESQIAKLALEQALTSDAAARGRIEAQAARPTPPSASDMEAARIAPPAASHPKDSTQAPMPQAEAPAAARGAKGAEDQGLYESYGLAASGEPARGAQAGAELRQVFLTGDSQAIEDAARRLGLLNESANFIAEREPLNYTVQGRPVYEFTLRPAPESFPGGLKGIALITFKMDHPTFRNRLLTGDPERGFQASYLGWGCLKRVPVLIEYADPTEPPKVALFPMCDRVQPVGRKEK